MSKTLLERMSESKDKHGVAYISISNDGKVRVDENYMTPLMNYANSSSAFDPIGEAMYGVNEAYARQYKFDALSMRLSLGLLFDGKYVDENQKIREDAIPVEGTVRYYTDTADCYLDGEKTNIADYGYIKGRQGFINYNRLVASAKKQGLVFNGPKTFEEFKEQILVGVPFEISLSASFKKNENANENAHQYAKTESSK